uniref:Cytochrome b n=1 Tax=Clavelina oblonga TaxID=286222 RepID=A0A024FSM3_9ASCI|nr:cytochrome b [Clavelina oblonga]CAL24385.1 cytochrome b [Clavelina oblonga]
MIRNGALVNLLYGSFVRLPSPINISYMWNFGSTIGLFLVSQILTGIFLTMHYISDVTLAFDSVVHIINEVNYGWIIRYMHMNGASFFLGLIYLHIGRGVYYKRYYSTFAWIIGVILLVLSMLTAFLGYVLPWGQMSFWGATVITNMVSALPKYGTMIVYWLWGGFSVGAPTLTRFYTFHFLFPFLIAIFAILHLYFIHSSGGSGNPLGMYSDNMKIPFWPYYGIKDILGYIVVYSMFLLVVFFFSDTFSDPDNYQKANPLVTPVHIKPEWYFLFAYAILRSIPNKLLGVISLIMSVLIFIFLPFSQGKFSMSVMYQLVFWLWVFDFMILTWLGGCPVKTVFNFMSQVFGLFYFFSFIFFSLL